MALIAWRSSRGLILASVIIFINSGSIDCYRTSYRKTIGCPSSPVGSPILLQEQDESLGSGLEGGMKLGKGG